MPVDNNPHSKPPHGPEVPSRPAKLSRSASGNSTASTPEAPLKTPDTDPQKEQSTKLVGGKARHNPVNPEASLAPSAEPKGLFEKAQAKPAAAEKAQETVQTGGAGSAKSADNASQPQSANKNRRNWKLLLKPTIAKFGAAAGGAVIGFCLGTLIGFLVGAVFPPAIIVSVPAGMAIGTLIGGVAAYLTGHKLGVESDQQAAVFDGHAKDPLANGSAADANTGSTTTPDASVKIREADDSDKKRGVEINASPDTGQQKNQVQVERQNDDKGLDLAGQRADARQVSDANDRYVAGQQKNGQTGAASPHAKRTQSSK